MLCCLSLSFIISANSMLCMSVSVSLISIGFNAADILFLFLL